MGPSLLYVLKISLYMSVTILLIKNKGNRISTRLLMWFRPKTFISKEPYTVWICKCKTDTDGRGYPPSQLTDTVSGLSGVSDFIKDRLVNVLNVWDGIL